MKEEIKIGLTLGGILVGFLRFMTIKPTRWFGYLLGYPNAGCCCCV